MNTEPIFTVGDLKAMKPSDAIEKAAEAYPDIEYRFWCGVVVSLDGTTGRVACAAALLTHALGVRAYTGPEMCSVGVTSELYAGVVREHPSAVPDLAAGGYGHAISVLSSAVPSGSPWSAVVERFRSLGL